MAVELKIRMMRRWNGVVLTDDDRVSAEGTSEVRASGMRLLASDIVTATKESPPADREVLERVSVLMRDERLGYTDAFKRVLASDTGLAERYRKAHQLRLAGNTSAWRGGKRVSL